MNLFLPNESSQETGGGFSFLRHFKKAIKSQVATELTIVENYAEADLIFIAGASLCKPEVAEQAKADGKRVVLRVDNALRHSRNNGKGMARMQRMAQVADLVIYQCQWAEDFLDDFLGHPQSVIIYNGTDLDVFKPDGPKLEFDSTPIFLYSAAAKGENKRWDWAWWRYMQYQKQYPDALLLIAGKISIEVMEHNFDFFQGENYRYLGMMTNLEDMAKVYRSADYLFATFENDCYSNALLEALACGVELVDISMTGGTPELLANRERGREFNGVNRMIKEYAEALEALL